MARILIVEDEAILAMDFCEQLKNMGHEVVGVAGNGREALELAGKTKPEIVLMDINLRGSLNGIETAELLYKTRGCLDIKVVYLTAHSNGKIIERARKAKLAGFINKLCVSEKLKEAIEAVVSDKFFAFPEN